MSDKCVMPELKQILGALIFAADRPLSIREMRKCLCEVAEKEGGELSVFKEVKDKDIRLALDELGVSLTAARCGCHVAEIAGGYRLRSDPSCGAWVKHMLALDKPARLSRPALETLAIIAYRQPVTRADIESVRGVNVDHMMKILLEMQLIRITGRSDLPGRPFLYGTSQRFLEHFGLKNLRELSEIDPMLAGKKAPVSRAPRTGQPEAATEAAEVASLVNDTEDGESAIDEDSDEDSDDDEME